MPWAKNGALGEKEKISACLASSQCQWPEAFSLLYWKPVFGSEFFCLTFISCKNLRTPFFPPKDKKFLLLLCDVQGEVVKDHFLNGLY